jgi:hypothetical protein
MKSFFLRAERSFAFPIILLGLCAYAPTLSLPFFLDDHAFIEQNKSLERWTAAALKEDFKPSRESPRYLGYYRPLQGLTNRVEYHLWGLHPLGYHLVNLSLHIANGWLVALLLSALGMSFSAALMAGCLFVVHPIIVSELLMVSGRPQIMSMFFCLATLLLWRRRSAASLVGGALRYGLALLSKESSVVLPFLLVAMQCGTREVPRFRVKVLTATTMALLYCAVHNTLAPPDPMPAHLQTLAHFALRVLPVVIVRYAALMVFPYPLYLYRLIPVASLPLVCLSVTLLVAATLAAWRAGSWGRLAWAWFFISLIPVLPLLITGHYMLDHWAYPALMGFLIPLCVGMDRLGQSRSGRLWARGIFLSLLVFWSALAQLHTRIRRTDESNYRWALRYTVASPVLFNLGVICLRTGRAEEAIGYIEPVYRLYPDDPLIRSTMELAYKSAPRRMVQKSSERLRFSR